MAETFIITAKDRTAATWRGISAGLSRVAKSATVMRLSVAAAAGVGGIALLTRQSFKSIDALAKFSSQTGIAIESLAAFRHLADLSGVSAAKMNSSLERMGKRLGEASTGMGAAAKTLRMLNLDVKTLLDLKPEDQYQVLAERISQLSNRQQQAAATAAIFGREGLALLNVIDQGAEGFKRAAEEAKAYGLAVSRIDAAKIEATNDAITRARGVFKGIGNTIAVQVAPFVKKLADRFVEAAVASNGFRDTVIGGIDKTITAVGFLADVFRGLQVVWKTLEIGFKTLIAGILSEIQVLDQGLVFLLNKIPGVTAEANQTIVELAEASRGVLSETVGEMQDLLNRPLPSETFKQFVAEVKEEANSMGEAVAAGLSGRSLDEDVNAERLELQNEQREKELEAEAKHQQELLKIKRKAADQERKLRIRNFTGILSATGQLFSILGNASDAASKKEFKKQKKFNIAAAVMGTAAAVVNGLQTQPFFPLGIAMAAVALVAGLAQLRKIKSTSFEGGGSAPNLPTGGGASASAPTMPDLSQQVQTPTQQRNVTFVLQGEGAPSDEYFREVLAPGIAKAIDDGATNVMVETA